VRVSFDQATAELVGNAANGTDLPPVKLPGGGDLDLVFISGISPTAIASPNTALGLFTDILGNGADATMSSVLFYRDGTCTPFRVSIEGTNSATSPTIAVDPWTGGPMLTAAGGPNNTGPGKGPFQ
jgi:hypothetical protein